jgi:hypothetical protein
MGTFMNALCILKMNLRVALISLMLSCSFYTQSQPNADTSKNNQQEASDIVSAEPLLDEKQPERSQENPPIESQKISQDERLLKIKELEEEYGPFDAGLIKELIILGLEYYEQDNHELARDAFLRSLEIHRTNFGLYSSDKFPIVEQLIIVNRALGEWAEVNKYYEYLYWLYRRTYGEDSVKLIPMLSALVAWKEEAIEHQLLGDGKRLSSEAQRASRVARSIVKQYRRNQEKEAQALAQ